MADVSVKLVLLTEWLLSELVFALFVWEIEEGHVHRSLLVLLSKAQHELNRVNLLILGLGLFLLTLELTLLNLLNIGEVVISVATKIGLLCLDGQLNWLISLLLVLSGFGS